jgi:alanine dehydrogenase
MPGAVPRTSTYALTNATLPYLLGIAAQGWRAAVTADPALLRGLTAHDGTLANAGVGAALGIDAVDPAALVA